MTNGEAAKQGLDVLKKIATALDSENPQAYIDAVAALTEEELNCIFRARLMCERIFQIRRKRLP